MPGEYPRSTDVVVPLYRERASLPALVAALGRVADRLPGARVLLVDDGSADGTAEQAVAVLRQNPLPCPARVLRHRRNLGLAAALRTGFAAGRADVQCWFDADLSYDAGILPRLVQEIAQGADLALASPYHPRGTTESVPPVRLLLSRGLSRACRLLLQPKPYTWSSMVRAWRRDLLARCLPSREGHLGVTESLMRAQAKGARVREVPATLRGRAAGKSGMRVAASFLGQLGLLQDALLGRLEAEERPGMENA